MSREVIRAKVGPSGVAFRVFADRAVSTDELRALSRLIYSMAVKIDEQRERNDARGKEKP